MSCGSGSAALTGFGAAATSTTRFPAVASTSARLTIWFPSAEAPRMTSGAPSTQVPWPSKVAALHFRAEENGTVAVGRHPDGAGQALAIAWSVALGAGSA